MLRHLAAFVAERFPVYVSLPMAAAIAGGAAPASVTSLTVALATASVWCFLLGARLLDDLADLEADRLRRPARGLVTGRISAAALRHGTSLSWVASLLLLAPLAIESVVILVACCLWTRGYYLLRARSSAVLKPFLLNAAFAPLALLLPAATRSPLIPSGTLALFLWLCVVGHDFVHSIEGTADEPSPRYRVFVGSLCYFIALWTAGVFVAMTRDAYFALTLLAVTIPMTWLLASLLRRPNRERSERTYVPGGLVFILPLLSRLAHQLVR